MQLDSEAVVADLPLASPGVLSSVVCAAPTLNTRNKGFGL